MLPHGAGLSVGEGDVNPPVAFAHRGLWRRPEARNTTVALRAAVAEGFGVEFDVRMRGETPVVAHDKAEVGGAPSLEWVLLGLCGQQVPLRLVLDVKEVAAQVPAARMLALLPVARVAAHPAAYVLRADHELDPRLHDVVGGQRWIACVKPTVTGWCPAPGAGLHRGVVYCDAFESGPPDWRTAEAIGKMRALDEWPILTADEVYGRPARVEVQAAAWSQAFGVVTDRPAEFRAAWELAA